jgi:hypothetical protein
MWYQDREELTGEPQGEKEPLPCFGPKIDREELSRMYADWKLTQNVLKKISFPNYDKKRKEHIIQRSREYFDKIKKRKDDNSL